MQVSYYEDDDEATVRIHRDKWSIQAHREGEHVGLRFRNHCKGVCAEIDIELSCRDYDRLLCELSRAECGPRECDECEREPEIVKVIVFDQDDCDDERERPKPKTRTARKN